MRIVDFKGILLAPEHTVFSVIPINNDHPSTDGIWRKSGETGEGATTFYAIPMHNPAWAGGQSGSTCDHIRRAYYSDAVLATQIATSTQFMPGQYAGMLFGIWEHKELEAFVTELTRVIPKAPKTTP
jgi:hypothetical protein